MIFQHMLLDEVHDTLIDANPMKFDVATIKDVYQQEAALLFSYVYMYAPPPDIQVSEKSIADLALIIRNVFETVHNCVLSVDVVICLSRLLVENAQSCERRLMGVARNLIGAGHDDERSIDDVFNDIIDDVLANDDSDRTDELPSFVDEKEDKKWKLN